LKYQAKYVFKLLLEVALTLLFVTILSFVLMRLSPIDPATAYAKRNSAVVTDEQIEVIRVKLGMDKPLAVQYFVWIKKALHFDFGISLGTGHPVIKEIGKAVPVTLSVVGIAAVIMILGSLIFACIQYACRRKLLGKILSLLSIIGISIPPFYLAILFIDTFAVKLEWINVSGNSGSLRFLPTAICLSVLGISFYSRLLADNLEREMNEDYIMYARFRGLPEMRILVLHALPNAIVNLIPNFMQMLGLCLASAGIIERVFSLPGLGYLIIDGVVNRDSPLIHAAILFLALAIIVLDIMSALIQQFLQKNRMLKGGA
jgi:peptide/nickel transport system permease protein